MVEKSASRFAKKMMIALLCLKGVEEQRQFPREGAMHFSGQALLLTRADAVRADLITPCS